MNTNESSVTARLAEKNLALRFDQLPAKAIAMAKLCIIDFLAVSIGGATDPLVEILVEEAVQRGALGTLSLPGRSECLNVVDAALVGGTMAHALDYDDGSAAMAGHPTAPIAGALLPLAEMTGVCGRDAIAAFVAGYEMAARSGLLVSPNHYAQGFHPTGTVGALGAAMACAHLLKLGQDATLSALGIASTQAAGLISSFGTMGKPLHAGRAAANGLYSARLAAAGFVGKPDMLEVPYGFARAHGSEPNVAAVLSDAPGGFYILQNVFKFHAACGGTHPSIEAARELRIRHQLQADDIGQVDLHINPRFDRVCNIAEPTTGLELKFSVRGMAAAALLGLDTASPDLYSAETAQLPALIALRDRIRVVFDDTQRESQTLVSITLADGSVLNESFDSRSQIGSPTLAPRIAEKFLSLASPVLGDEKARQLLQSLEHLEELADIGDVLRNSRLPARP